MACAIAGALPAGTFFVVLSVAGTGYVAGVGLRGL
jgi:hypothetical protein